MGNTLPQPFLKKCVIEEGTALEMEYVSLRGRGGIFISRARTKKKEKKEQVGEAALRFIKKYKADLKALKDK